MILFQLISRTHSNRMHLEGRVYYLGDEAYPDGMRMGKESLLMIYELEELKLPW